jgi:hypothetical protein
VGQATINHLVVFHYPNPPLHQYPCELLSSERILQNRHSASDSKLTILKGKVSKSEDERTEGFLERTYKWSKRTEFDWERKIPTSVPNRVH